MGKPEHSGSGHTLFTSSTDDRWIPLTKGPWPGELSIYDVIICTVRSMKNARFAVFCCGDVKTHFTHIRQEYFTGTGAMIHFPNVSATCEYVYELHWRHNDHGGVSNHQPHDCLHKGQQRGKCVRLMTSSSDSHECCGNVVHEQNTTKPRSSWLSRIQMFPAQILGLRSNL